MNAPRGSYVYPIAWLFVLMSAVGLSMWIAVRLRRQYTAAQLPAALRLQATGLPFGHRAYGHLVGQVAHARRYQRPLSALILRLVDDDLLEGTDLKGASTCLLAVNRSRYRRLPWRSVRQSVALRLATILREATRESDMVAYDIRYGHFVILFPETTKPQAIQAMQRLYDLIYHRTCVSLRGGVAQFPADGVTLEALLHQAQEDCNLQKESS